MLTISIVVNLPIHQGFTPLRLMITFVRNKSTTARWISSPWREARNKNQKLKAWWMSWTVMPPRIPRKWYRQLSAKRKRRQLACHAMRIWPSIQIKVQIMGTKIGYAFRRTRFVRPIQAELIPISLRRIFSQAWGKSLSISHQSREVFLIRFSAVINTMTIPKGLTIIPPLIREIVLVRRPPDKVLSQLLKHTEILAVWHGMCIKIIDRKANLKCAQPQLIQEKRAD